MIHVKKGQKKRDKKTWLNININFQSPHSDKFEKHVYISDDQETLRTADYSAVEQLKIVWTLNSMKSFISTLASIIVTRNKQSGYCSIFADVMKLLYTPLA